LKIRGVLATPGAWVQGYKLTPIYLNKGHSPT
jgi:hypothetical protein